MDPMYTTVQEEQVAYNSVVCMWFLFVHHHWPSQVATTNQIQWLRTSWYHHITMAIRVCLKFYHITSCDSRWHRTVQADQQVVLPRFDSESAKTASSFRRNILTSYFIIFLMPSFPISFPPNNGGSCRVKIWQVKSPSSFVSWFPSSVKQGERDRLRHCQPASSTEIYGWTLRPRSSRLG